MFTVTLAGRERSADRNGVDDAGGIIYLISSFMSIQKGHWVMFIIGFFLPFFWLIGALMPSPRLATR